MYPQTDDCAVVYQAAGTYQTTVTIHWYGWEWETAPWPTPRPRKVTLPHHLRGSRSRCLRSAHHPDRPVPGNRPAQTRHPPFVCRRRHPLNPPGTSPQTIWHAGGPKRCRSVCWVRVGHPVRAFVGSRQRCGVVGFVEGLSPVRSSSRRSGPSPRAWVRYWQGSFQPSARWFPIRGREWVAARCSLRLSRCRVVLLGMSSVV